jgi:transcriptional regulator with XRE-family HTH domain
MIEEQANALARTVRDRRQALGLSLDQLSARAGVSKGALVALENGDGNPTFSTIVRVADALQTPVSMLFEASSPAPVRVITHADVPEFWRGERGGYARLLLTVPGVTPVEYWSWLLHPGESYVSHPHPEGVREVITVLSGVLLLTLDGKVESIQAGATALFAADQAHSYAAGEEQCAFLMQVHLPASHGATVG